MTGFGPNTRPVVCFEDILESLSNLPGKLHGRGVKDKYLQRFLTLTKHKGF